MKKILQKLLLAASVTLSVNAFALQEIDVKDGQTVFVKMGLHDFNRIAIANGRIRLVKGADNSVVEGDKDAVTGQVLIKPLVNHQFSLFVFSENNKVFTLVIQPADIPAESIILNDTQTAAIKGEPKPGPIERAASFEEKIKKMLEIMTGAASDSGMTVDRNIVQVKLWQGTQLFQTAKWTGLTFEGTEYRLYNLSKSPVQITEQEFYKDGVLAVSVQNLSILPQQYTKVYVIEAAGDK